MRIPSHLSTRCNQKSASGETRRMTYPNEAPPQTDENTNDVLDVSLHGNLFIRLLATKEALHELNQGRRVSESEMEAFWRRVGAVMRIYFSPHSPADVARLHCPASIFAAAITACVRLSTRSFCRIAETCAFTVASETS